MLDSSHVTFGVVIVTHRSGRALPGLLDDLREHEPGVPIIVVDSGSPEGPPAAAAPEVIALDRNAGYAAACNTGADRLLEEGVGFLAFLNPDLRLRGPSLSQLAAGLADRPRTGVATGPIHDPNRGRVPSAWGPTSCLRAFWFATGWRLPRVRATVGRVTRHGIAASGASMTADDLLVDGHVLGGAMVVRRGCWREIGGFDPSFFLYWEDADLCERARAAGWEVRLLPCTPMVHEAGTSSAGVTDAERWSWYVDGADRFAAKHLTERHRRRLRAALRLGRAVGGGRMA